MIKEIVCTKCDSVYEGSRDRGECPECRKASRKEYLRNYRQQPDYSEERKEKYRLLRDAVIEGYGGRCACCGETTREFLAIDHVDGDGRVERKTRSIQQIMTAIVKQGFPSDYRVLCHNCNQSLGWYGYCPHDNLTTNAQVIKIGRKRTS